MADTHGKPEPGAECMTTFEDIDESNYVECEATALCSRAAAALVRTSLLAAASHPSLTIEMAHACGRLERRYQGAPSGKWYPAKFEQSVVEHLVGSQFDTYCKKVQTSDCAAEMRRLMEKGPPIWVSDPHGLALPEGETHIQQLWFSSDGVERSAKLTGAVEGDERQTMWDEHKMLFKALVDAEAANGESAEPAAEGASDA